MRARQPILSAAAVLLLAGCGNSSPGSSSMPNTSGAAASTSAQTPSYGQPSTSTTASGSASSAASSPASVAAATGGASPAPGAKKPLPPATNVRVPATFAIDGGGKLVPSTVSSPAFLAVQVSVSDGDGHAHRIVVHTPTLHTLMVPAGGRAAVLIPGLRAGQYAIDVDGSPKGALLIGGEPGP